jgi:alpha-mannosidase
VRIRVRRRAGEPTYRLEGRIDNGRPDHRLRLSVALPSPGSGSLAGSPFELVRRPLRSEGGEVEAPSATWPARHVVLAGGIAAFHEGVVEYEVTTDELRLTLLRGVGTISRERLATRPWPAGPDVATPDAQSIGTTTFSIGLALGLDEDDLLPWWERFAIALPEAPAVGGGRLPGRGSLLEIGGEAALSSVRVREGAVEARLWNPRADRPARSSVAGRAVVLAPARIETVRLEGSPGPPRSRPRRTSLPDRDRRPRSRSVLPVI